jgi:hypothetical protein
MSNSPPLRLFVAAYIEAAVVEPCCERITNLHGTIRTLDR